MERALGLALRGLGAVSPNPMVGAVIVAANGKIIGEGFHRRYGDAHAEVNAIESVAAQDRGLLGGSTLYVTLEPCSHQGKTPPCADLVVQTRFKRVVVGAVDPFREVSGRGISRIKEAGIEVVTDVLGNECRSLNARFFTAHTLRRPFVILKWAESAEGIMGVRSADGYRMRISGELGETLVHRLRANCDAIAVGSGTALADNPRLDVRIWNGRNPMRVVFDRRGRVKNDLWRLEQKEIPEVLSSLYNENVTSIVVEGGATVLNSFIVNGLWDVARIERGATPSEQRADCDVVAAPRLTGLPLCQHKVSDNRVFYYSNNELVDKFFIENVL